MKRGSWGDRRAGACPMETIFLLMNWCRLCELREISKTASSSFFLPFIRVLLLLLRPPWFILFQRAGSSNRSIHHRIFVLCFAFSSVTHEALQVGLSTLRIKTFGILSLLLAHKTMPLGPATLISSDWKSFPFVCLGGLRDKRWCRDPPKELWQPEEMPVRREYTSSTLPQRLLGNKNCGGFRQLWRARTHTQLADGGDIQTNNKNNMPVAQDDSRLSRLAPDEKQPPQVCSFPLYLVILSFISLHLPLYSHVSLSLSSGHVFRLHIQESCLCSSCTSQWGYQSRSRFETSTFVSFLKIVFPSPFVC